MRFKDFLVRVIAIDGIDGIFESVLSGNSKKIEAQNVLHSVMKLRISLLN
ncbi:hypothetical protein [Algoriphagus formosus]|nr:hypothetical protein [Algoriphagus aquimaris]